MILGIDTSCYTTSLAVVDHQERLIFDSRKLLAVKPGKRGLQQSEAVFQHLQNIPDLFEELCQRIDIEQIQGVAYSTRPRPVQNSYMPVFTVSQNFGRVFSNTKKISAFQTSHQEGHIKAGLWSAQGPERDKFLAVHLSGGTSEVLLINKSCGSIDIEIIGGTSDLHAGQFIDRIGVALGMGFPAGPDLEEQAKKWTEQILYLPTGVKGYEISFSGPETAARKLIAAGVPRAGVCRAVEHCVATTLEKVLRKAVSEYQLQDILVVGGVASNAYIKKRLMHRLEHRAVGAKLYFAEPRYASDNAVGVALLGWEQFNKA